MRRQSLEKIIAVDYKNRALNGNEVERFFNRRKRAMVFFVDNPYVEKIEQKVFEVLRITYRNGTVKDFAGKILTYEKSKYENNYFVGIEFGSEKDLEDSLLYDRELTEAFIFFKRVKQIDIVFPDLTVVLNNNDDIFEVPFCDAEGELMFNQVLTRNQVLGIVEAES